MSRKSLILAYLLEYLSSNSTYTTALAANEALVEKKSAEGGSIELAYRRWKLP